MTLSCYTQFGLNENCLADFLSGPVSDEFIGRKFINLRNHHACNQHEFKCCYRAKFTQGF